MKRVALIIAVLVLVVVGVRLITRVAPPPSRQLSQAEFASMLESNLIAQATVFFPAEPGSINGAPTMVQSVRGTYFPTDSAGQRLVAEGKSVETRFHASIHLTPDADRDLSHDARFQMVERHWLVRKAERWVGVEQ